MKVKELIELLSNKDPEKEVFIQQGEESDYMAVYSVKEKELIEDFTDNDYETIKVVVIEYC